MDSKEWIAHSIDEAHEMLAEAIMYTKEQGEKPKLLVHTSSWLCSAYAELTGKHALAYITEAWEEGEEKIDSYDWIRAGIIRCEIGAHNFGIVISLYEDVVRDGKSQAQQNAMAVATAEIFGE